MERKGIFVNLWKPVDIKLTSEEVQVVNFEKGSKRSTGDSDSFLFYIVDGRLIAIMSLDCNYKWEVISGIITGDKCVAEIKGKGRQWFPIVEKLVQKSVDLEEIDNKINKFIKDRNLELPDTNVLKEIVGRVVDSNPKAVDDFLNGKKSSIGALIGKVLQESKGADPQMVRELLETQLKEKEMKVQG